MGAPIWGMSTFGKIKWKKVKKGIDKSKLVCYSTKAVRCGRSCGKAGPANSKQLKSEFEKNLKKVLDK